MTLPAVALAASLIPLASAAVHADGDRDPAGFIAAVAAGPAGAPPGVVQDPNSLHWAIRLGLRGAATDAITPIIDRVVLVPDEATYLDELSRWSPKGRWPVLIENDPRVPMFVRRFAPAELLRRESIDVDAPEGGDLVQASLTVIRNAWGAAPEVSIPQALAERSHAPAGIVIASTNDPAWTAAIAIAAYRGQPIAWFDMALGGPDDALTAEQASALTSAVEQMLDGSGLPWRDEGDVIEALTVCRRMASRAGIAPSWPIASPREEDRRGTVAVTDLLGRANGGKRGAYCGWIWGESAAATYMAMCGLFLDADDALFVSGYRDSEPWVRFDPTPGAAILRKAGYDVKLRLGEEATAGGWRRSLPRGWATDLLMINSGGNADFMIVANNEQLRAADMPILDRPAAMQLVHSWSLRAPTSPATIGGRFLRNGAYVYVGSVEEPFLPAFVPPSIVADRLSVGVPMLVAARHWEGDGSRLWRVATIGDPLTRLPPASLERRVRASAATLAPESPRSSRAADLRARLTDVLRAAVTEQSDSMGAEALGILDLLGETGPARRLWIELDRTDVAGPASAMAAMPSLFRAGDADAFLNAWMRASPPQSPSTPPHPGAHAASWPRLVDMLWQLVPDRLGAAPSIEVIDAFARAARPGVASDLARVRAWRGS